MTSTLLFQTENNNNYYFFLIFKKVTVKKAAELGGGQIGVRPHKEGMVAPLVLVGSRVG